MTVAIRSLSKGFRRGRGVGATRKDAYKLDSKLAGTACCTGCGAVYCAGRWSWRARPAEARSITCPACRRIHDRFPAGELRLEGAFLERHDELMGLIRNVEEREKSLHPLERLMSVRRQRGVLVVQTTGMHLARRIADALRRAFHRKATLKFSLGEDFVRVEWL